MIYRLFIAFTALSSLNVNASEITHDFAAEYARAAAPANNALLRPGERWKCVEQSAGVDSDSIHGLMYGEIDGILQDFPSKFVTLEGEFYSYYAVKNHERIKEIRVDEDGNLLIRNSALDSAESDDFGTSPTNRIADRLMGYHPAPLVITGYSKCAPVADDEVSEDPSLLPSS